VGSDACSKDSEDEVEEVVGAGESGRLRLRLRPVEEGEFMVKVLVDWSGGCGGMIMVPRILVMFCQACSSC